VQVLKEKIKQKEGIAVGEQRLIFRGRELFNSRTLHFYKIQNEAVVHLVVRLN